MFYAKYIDEEEEVCDDWLQSVSVLDDPELFGKKLKNYEVYLLMNKKKTILCYFNYSTIFFFDKFKFSFFSGKQSLLVDFLFNSFLNRKKNIILQKNRQ